jgi:hypothetical protein
MLTDITLDRSTTTASSALSAAGRLFDDVWNQVSSNKVETCLALTLGAAATAMASRGMVGKVMQLLVNPRPFANSRALVRAGEVLGLPGVTEKGSQQLIDKASLSSVARFRTSSNGANLPEWQRMENLGTAFPANRPKDFFASDLAMARQQRAGLRTYHLNTEHTRGAELNGLLKRYWSGDSSIHLLQQDEAQRWIIGALDKSTHTFITQNLTACKACLVVAESPAGTRIVVFSHFRPGFLEDNLKALDRLLPSPSLANTDFRSKVLMFIPADNGWKVSYRTHAFGRTKTADGTLDQSRVIMDKIKSKLPLGDGDIAMLRYRNNGVIESPFRQHGTAAITIPGDRSLPIIYNSSWLWPRKL